MYPPNDNPPTRRLAPSIAIVLAVFVIGATSGVVLATHQSSTPTYTGCLGSKSGQLYSLSPGDEPLRPCHKGDSMIHLSGGDITAVHAGDGLRASGGEESGDVDLAVNESRLDERYRNADEPPAHHDHNDTYVNHGEFQSVSPFMLEFGFYHGLDADRLDGHHASDFLTEPSVSGYEVVRTETTHAGDVRHDTLVQKAVCSPGKVVLGGGGFINVNTKHIDSMRPITPEIDPGSSYGWRVSFRVDEKIGWDFTTTAYAICVEIDDEP